jgi:hypothetical protein
MTVKQFAVKYDIPLGRVKAAMGHRKGGTNTNYEATIEYEEEKLKEEMFHYLFRDLMSCLEYAHEDKQQMDRIVVRKNSNADNEKDGV